METTKPNFANGLVIAYVTSFEFGLPHLAEVKIKSETDASYLGVEMLQDGLCNLGLFYRVSKRLSKNDRHAKVFSTAKAALDYLYGQTLEVAKAADEQMQLVKLAMEQAKNL